MHTVSVMTETAEKEISSVSDDESMKAAYVSILEEIYYNHTFPDGEDYGFFDSSHISDNKFAVCDIDQDGKDELIIQYITTYMAGMVELIYDYDKESDTVRTEFGEFPAITFYDNGVIEAGFSHNQGLAGDFWPYNLYQYEPDSDAYIMVGMIDAKFRRLFPSETTCICFNLGAIEFLLPKILSKIAKKEGISIAEVEREMKRDIDAGFDNPSEEIQREWAKVTFRGERPTPEEVIDYFNGLDKM